MGVDLGVLWKVPAARLNLAAAVANLGPDIKHVDAEGRNNGSLDWKKIFVRWSSPAVRWIPSFSPALLTRG